MSRAQANLLRAFSLWTIYVWATRIWNIVADDHSLGFTVVHSALAAISIALAVAAWVVVARVRRAERRRVAERDPLGDDDRAARVG